MVHSQFEKSMKFLRPTPPKNLEKSNSTGSSPLSSLYSQQRQLTRAQNVTDDANLKQAYQQRQDQLSRRIGRLQAQEKTESDG